MTAGTEQRWQDGILPESPERRNAGYRAPTPRLSRQAGTLSMTSSPEVAAEFVRKEQEKWRGIAAETGIRME